MPEVEGGASQDTNAFSTDEVVPDAVRPPPGNRRFPLLDGIRAIAVLSVVVVHVDIMATPNPVPLDWLLARFNIGVTIFFLISGFLLYRPFIAHRCGGAARPAIGRYARRRALRIFPAYWLALTVLVVLPSVTGVTDGEWLPQYALVHTIPLPDTSQSCVNQIFECGMAQTWSLVVELTFYAALPLWFLLSERLARGRSTRAWVQIEILGLALLAAISLFIHFGPEAARGTLVAGTLLGYMLWFALGMALAVVSVAMDRPGRRSGAVAAIAGRPGLVWTAAMTSFIAFAALFQPSNATVLNQGRQFLTHVTFGVIAALIILPAIFSNDAGTPRRFLANPVVRWLGLISYGIFLWHYVVALEFGLPGEGLAFWPLLVVTLAISIACAAISYYALERPLLRLKDRRLTRGTRSEDCASSDATTLPRRVDSL